MPKTRTDARGVGVVAVAVLWIERGPRAYRAHRDYPPTEICAPEEIAQIDEKTT
ncbi:MAG: hypothetical protein H7Y39_13160 [Nitrospiraceae bacterium]|nr:hypothetical protein [Nitrospiraceae bacterium]